jgi:hypothetical protein
MKYDHSFFTHCYLLLRVKNKQEYFCVRLISSCLTFSSMNKNGRKENAGIKTEENINGGDKK